MYNEKSIINGHDFDDGCLGLQSGCLPEQMA